MADTNTNTTAAKPHTAAPAQAAAPKAATAQPAAPKAAESAPDAAAKAAARKPAARKAKAAPAKRVRAAAKKTVSKTIRNSNKGTKTMTNETAKVADRVQAVFGDVNERAKTAVAKTTKVAEELTDLTRGNVEAFVASSKIAAKGIETLGQGAADYGRRSFEDASAALKSFAEVKSPTDFFKLQSDYVRSAFDGWVSESAKASEAVIKLAGEVAEPITSRYTVAADRVKSLAL